MDITILQNGFVTGDFLEPVAYAGEMNSRIINITHPLFDNSFYQLIIIKENRPYRIGINNGTFILPPSLTDVACTLQCQFVAARKNDSTQLTNCDCAPISSNDCSNLVFKSDSFNMIVKEGLKLNGLTPIPPYEQLVDMYNNLEKAKMLVEKSKLENQHIAEKINDKIEDLQSSQYLNSLDNERQVRNNQYVNIQQQLTNINTVLNNITELIESKSIYTIKYYVNDKLVKTDYKRHNEIISISDLQFVVEDKEFEYWVDNETIYYVNDDYTENKDLILHASWK